jgi:hypothetical protein
MYLRLENLLLIVALSRGIARTSSSVGKPDIKKEKIKNKGTD